MQPLPRKELLGRLGDPLMMAETPEPSERSDLIQDKMEEFYDRADSTNETSGGEHDVLDLAEDVRRSSLTDDEHDVEHGQLSASLSTHLLQLDCKRETLHDQEEMLKEKSVSQSVELQELQEKLELLKAAVEMASDDKHPADVCAIQLNNQIELKRSKIIEIENHWNDKRKALEHKKGCLEEMLKETEPEAYVRYKKAEEIELDLESVLAEKKKREEELIVLSAKAEKQPKLERRRAYIQRVEEITKNSRKQDADIERILNETRQLQLESNSIQERLNRTHAVVDETVFREAKKDQVGREAYRMLTRIHDSFEQIAENLLATDRARREVADYEGKLAALVTQSVDIDNLQTDLDAIKRENDLLEKNFSKDL